MSYRVLVTLFISIPAVVLAADSVTLTLQEAVKMALAHNRTIKLARLFVQEK